MVLKYISYIFISDIFTKNVFNNKLIFDALNNRYNNIIEYILFIRLI